MEGDGDVGSPRALHPAFYGSYDWHSCVHMHWLLARLLRRVPGPVRRARDRGRVRPAPRRARRSRRRSPTSAARARSPSSAPTAGRGRSSSREEVARGAGDRVPRAGRRTWRRSPTSFVARYLDYLPKANHPLRTGMHPNSAFGIAFALDYARARARARAGRAVRGQGARLVRAGPRLPGRVGAVRGPTSCRRRSSRPTRCVACCRSASSRPGSTPSCPGSPPARRQRSSRPPCRPIAAIRRSCTSTGSICRARGASTASPARSTPLIRARGRCAAAADAHRAAGLQGRGQRRLHGRALARELRRARARGSVGRRPGCAARRSGDEGLVIAQCP